MPPLMVGVALTGGVHGKEANPNLPETIEEQVEAAYQAYMAGAVSAHVHVRNPSNTANAVNDPELFSRVNAGIRERCPGMIVNNSTSGGPDRTAFDKIAAARADVLPDMCSFNPGPFMYIQRNKARVDPVPFPSPAREIDICSPITYGDIRYWGEVLKEKGIRPEIEIFNSGHFWSVNYLIEQGLIEPPYVLQFVMGFQTGTYPTPKNVGNAGVVPSRLLGGSTMSNGYFHRVMAKTPTVFWINNVTLEQADLDLEAGARNCTQNPSFPWKMLNSSAEADKAQGYLDSLLASHPEDEALLAELQYLLIRDIAERFHPLHRQSAGYDGWVTIQGSPLHEDTATILAYAKRCHTEVSNLMLKIPATPAGLAAMEKLAAEGCPLLATEVMSVAQAMDVCEIFEKIYRTMENPPAMAFAHIPGIFDEQLGNTVAAGGIQVDPDALWQAGI